MGKLTEDKDYFNKVCLQINLGVDFPSLVIKIFFSSWHRKGTFLLRNLLPAFGRKEDVRELFVHLLFLNSLQLKIISIPQQHILGQYVLIPSHGFKFHLSSHLQVTDSNLPLLYPKLSVQKLSQCRSCATDSSLVYCHMIPKLCPCVIAKLLLHPCLCRCVVCFGTKNQFQHLDEYS